MKGNRNVNKYIKDCKHFFPFLSKNEKTFLKRLKTNIIENIDLDNVTSVSYTHLDVYKRQIKTLILLL